MHELNARRFIGIHGPPATGHAGWCANVRPSLDCHLRTTVTRAHHHAQCRCCVDNARSQKDGGTNSWHHFVCDTCHDVANVTHCDIHWAADVAGDSVWPTRAAGYNVLARVAARRWRYDGSVVDHILHVSAAHLRAAMLVMALVGMVRVSVLVIGQVGLVRVSIVIALVGMVRVSMLVIGQVGLVRVSIVIALVGLVRVSMLVMALVGMVRVSMHVIALVGLVRVKCERACLLSGRVYGLCAQRH
jgi:hypothetical protein